jgi:hypothetical protein
MPVPTQRVIRIPGTSVLVSRKVARRRVNRALRRFGLGLVEREPVPELPRWQPDVGEIIRRVQPFTMTSGERLAALCDAVDYVVANELPGAIVECGVWRGGSTMAALLRLQQRGVSRPVYLFDTFAGMPEPGEHDRDWQGQPARERWEREARDDGGSTWASASVEEVRGNLAAAGCDLTDVHFVPGPVEQTLPEHAPPDVAILRLDTDFYDSTRHELVHLYPRLVSGGVLLVDDYGHWAGARRAVDEYVREHRLRLFLQPFDRSGARLAVKP